MLTAVSLEQDGAQPFPERRPARIAAGDHVAAETAQPIRQPACLRRLAAAVGTIEHQEETGMSMGARARHLFP